MKLLITGLVLLTTLTAARAQAGDGWIKVYLGDQDRNQIQASGTCTIVIQPTGGKRITLKAEPVSEEGGSGHLDHGGQVIAKGDHTVEFVLEMPVEEHEHAEGAHGHDESKGGHEEKSEHGHEHGEEEAAASFSHFQAPLGELGKDGTDLTFDAVVIIKTDDGTFNVKGFEYPFLDFATITTMMDKHLDEIQTLIDGSKLLKVHPVASKIQSWLSRSQMRRAFPKMTGRRLRRPARRSFRFLVRSTRSPTQKRSRRQFRFWRNTERRYRVSKSMSMTRSTGIITNRILDFEKLTLRVGKLYF